MVRQKNVFKFFEDNKILSTGSFTKELPKYYNIWLPATYYELQRVLRVTTKYDLVSSVGNYFINELLKRKTYLLKTQVTKTYML